KGQRIAHGRRICFPQLRASLNVREQEGDRAGWERPWSHGAFYNSGKLIGAVADHLGFYSNRKLLLVRSGERRRAAGPPLLISAPQFIHALEAVIGPSV